jgi:8-oxo-dGTP diphosphatase
MPDAEFKHYLRPGVAADVVLLTLQDNTLKVGLVKRKEDPYFGKCALPGRFVRYDEKITDTARIALETKANIDTKDVYLEQLYTYGDTLDRDTRIITITIVYYGFVNSAKVKDQKDNQFIWADAYALPQLAFDHKNIINSALERIQEKLFTTPLVFNLLPKEFTLSQLQQACELLLHTILDKRNFRKKINEVYILKDTKRQHIDGAHRPATMYSFVKMK